MRLKQKKDFTPLEKFSDFNRRSLLPEANGGLKSSTQTVRKRSLTQGFTLIELVIVVVILGILTSIALPTYTGTREKALDKEAIASLKLLRVANLQYFSRSGFFYCVPDLCWDQDVHNINWWMRIELNSSNWIFRVCGGSTFRGLANRSVAGGTRQWYIDNAMTEPVCSGSCY